MKILSETLDERLHDLEEDFDRLQLRLDVVEQQVREIKMRIAASHPERHYCPHCRGLISPLSEVCGNCGRTLKTPKDPKSGQPV